MTTMTMSVAATAKIASILAHLEEFASEDGHPFDRTAAVALLADPEVQAFIEAARARGLVPLRRRRA